MRVSNYIVEILRQVTVDTIFGYVGGYNQDIVDAVFSNQKFNFVLNYHEQASAFAVNAFAMVKEDISVATSSGAPSSCNLIAGIANAYFDSIPCLFLVGSAHSKAVRKSKSIRQNAFEEIDMVSLAHDITKYAVKVEKPEDIKFCLEKAIYMAKEGRKGPVLVDIPYDIARSDVRVDQLRSFIPEKKEDYSKIELKEVKTILEKSKKPLILLGGGARSRESKNLIQQLLNKVKIPVVASLCGLDVLPHNHSCFLGFIGHYGHRYANLAMSNCDSLIVLGSRLDERQLGGYYTKFDSNMKVIRVDIDPVEIGRKIPETLSYYSSVENFLQKIVESNWDGLKYSKWLEVVNIWKKRYPAYDLSSRELDANNFLHIISDYLPKEAIICADVGQNQMSVAQALRLDDKRMLLNSAGYGSMGYSLPAAIGASYATNKERCVLSINGDGGLQMNIQELQTIKRDHLPINIIVLNNNCLGMIRRLQETMYDSRYSASVKGYSVPNYSAIALAYDIKYLKIDSLKEYHLVKDLINTPYPTLIEVMLPQNMNNLPEPGPCIEKQSPMLSDEEFFLIQKECQF